MFSALSSSHFSSYFVFPLSPSLRTEAVEGSGRGKGEACEFAGGRELRGREAPPSSPPSKVDVLRYQVRLKGREKEEVRNFPCLSQAGRPIVQLFWSTLRVVGRVSCEPSLCPPTDRPTTDCLPTECRPTERLTELIPSLWHCDHVVFFAYFGRWRAAGEGGGKAARQGGSQEGTDRRTEEGRYLAAERNAAAAAAALRWKRHFLLSVRFALSSVSGRRTEAEDEIASETATLSPSPPPRRRLLSAPPADTLSSLLANGSSTQLLILQKKWRRAWAGARNAGKAFSHSSPPQFMP